MSEGDNHRGVVVRILCRAPTRFAQLFFAFLLYFFHLNFRQYHDAKAANGQEDWHQSEGGFLKPVIFGGLDGILTSFAIVAGAAGGGLSPEVVLVLGFSNIFADALR